MIDSAYYKWFSREFTNALALTWCSATNDVILAAYGISPERTQSARLNSAGDLRMLIGRVGNGALIIEFSSSPADETLTALAQHGPCLSVQWSDFVPPLVSYRAKNGLVVSFDPLDWDWDPIPDYASVEQWVAATPADRETWDDNWGLATLITAEALCQAAIDDEWVQSTHIGIS
ncbi:hypothetical protein [Nonomuraea sp. B19D2]|uniref:hypothetical protein n=1 Tax=Nonomuraea sp. B19D2 TaxID=3159561 RepID=UPI0032DAD3A6